jgi:hypothetical protein
LIYVLSVPCMSMIVFIQGLYIKSDVNYSLSTVYLIYFSCYTLTCFGFIRPSSKCIYIRRKLYNSITLQLEFPLNMYTPWGWSVDTETCWGINNARNKPHILRSWFTSDCNVDSISWQEVLGRTNRLLSLIWHGPHWKWRVQQFFYCCVCICYRGNVPIKPLPSNNRGIFTEPNSSLATIGDKHTDTHTDWWEGFFN